jgi:hypothetical protein
MALIAPLIMTAELDTGSSQNYFRLIFGLNMVVPCLLASFCFLMMAKDYEKCAQMNK